MRVLRAPAALVAALGAALVATALAVVPLAVAEAAGTGDPVIESPASTAKLYAGFTGPFVVEFKDAPSTTYDYFVETAPADGGTPVMVQAKRTFEFAGSFTRPELRVAALGPGSYTFHVIGRADGADGADGAASLRFTVLPGKPPACSIVVPTQVRMKAKSFLVTARLSPTCATLKTTYAAWEARHPVGGFAQTFIFNNAKTDFWRIYDDERTGTYTIRPNSAKNTANVTVPQNTARLTMRRDSRLSLSAQRSGSVVTLRTKSIRYSPSANAFKVWSKRKVVLSYRTCGSCAWKRLKVRTTDKNGITSYRVTASKKRQYRATALGTSTTWAPRPAYVRR